MVGSTNMAAVSLLLFSVLLLHFTQAEQLMRFDGAPSPSPLAQPIDCGDAGYPRGKICAKGRAGVAVPSATVFPQGLPATMKPALAMPT
ncbi:hypothetical protein GQ457_02G006850 [Hibiscus cannabinus]